MTQFVIIIDASIVNVALPSIGRGLNFASADLSWVVNAYTLTFGGFLLLGGRLADVLGRRRMFIAGLILFSLASLAGGLAQSEGWLIAARAVQGLGGAIVSPAALSIVTTTFSEGAERNRALGVWGAVAGAGGAAGVLLGGGADQRPELAVGAVRQRPDRTALRVSGPAAAGRESQRGRGAHVRRDRRRHRHRGPGPVRLRLVDTTNVGWGATATWLRIAGAVLLLVAFVLIERRVARPLVRFAILAAGVSYLPLSVVIIVSAGAASVLVTRLGFKPVLIFGQICIAVGLLWFAQVSADGSFAADVLGPSIVAAAGLGFSFVPVTIAALSGTSASQAGLASGLINTSQQVGGALGLAILATVAGSLTRSQARSGTAPAIALTHGFDRAFLVGAGFAIAGAILTATLISSRDSRQHVQAAQSGDAPATAI